MAVVSSSDDWVRTRDSRVPTLCLNHSATLPLNGVGIIPAYIPLIIDSDDMEPTKYYSLSATARGCGVLKQMMVYACRNRCTRIARQKGGSEVFRIQWLD